MRIIQNRLVASGSVKTEEGACWSMGLNGHRIQEALNKWKVDALTGDLYRFMDADDSDLKLIYNAFGIQIPAKLYRRAELKALKKEVAIFI